MSSSYYKTKYYCEGNYGHNDERLLYVQHNRSCDVVTFYDDDGEFLLSISDTIDNNMYDAIEKLYSPYVNDNLREDVHTSNKNEIETLFNDSEHTINRIIKQLNQLSNDDRVQIFDNYCKYCGKIGKCYCGPEYDD